MPQSFIQIKNGCQTDVCSHTRHIHLTFMHPRAFEEFADELALLTPQFCPLGLTVSPPPVLIKDNLSAHL